MMDIYVGRYFGATSHRGARVAVRRASSRNWEVVEDRDPAIDPTGQMSRLAERLSGASVVAYTTDERTGDVLMVVAHPDVA